MENEKDLNQKKEHLDKTNVLQRKLEDATTPGYQAELSPEEAEKLGAFVEDALSEEDALASTEDLFDESLEVAFLNDNETTELPEFVNRKSAKDLLGMAEDETVQQAITRLNKKG